MPNISQGLAWSLSAHEDASGGSLPSTVVSFHPRRKLEGIRVRFHQQGVFYPHASVGHRSD